MENHPADIAYVYAQLGLAYGASRAEAQEVFDNACAYRFFIKERIERVGRLVRFFAAREKFGDFETSFDQIKKAYYRRAMDLHPDTNKGNKETEEELKDINAAYALIEDINRQAKAYYKQDEIIRRKSEWRTREETEKERPEGIKKNEQSGNKAEKPKEKPRPTSNKETNREQSVGKGTKTYLAVSVPRMIRTSRLSYLPLRTIIGSKAIMKDGDVSFIFDFIMLTDKQFLRARSYLAAPETAVPTLQYGKFSPPYIPQDVKKIIVPADISDPETYAKDHFIKIFEL